MRKINTRNFRLATRSTSRDVNRQIVLNLIRELGPISRAELARRMGVRRTVLTTIVRDLLAAGAIAETGTAPTARGRRPILLAVRTRERLALAVDVRPGHTTVALADFAGRIMAKDTFPTPSSPRELILRLGPAAQALLDARRLVAAEAECEGVGIVVPGMVDRRTGRVLYAPPLGWRNAELRDALAERLNIPVFVESAPIACALARLWASPEETRGVHSFAYVSVSEGVGVGLVVNGEALRGQTHTAGEFGHVSLDPNGPRCACGKRGCWEAFASNAATVARYRERSGGDVVVAIAEIVRRAREGEEMAQDTLRESGRHIGRGLAAVVSAFNPGRIYIGGEITAAWQVLEQPIRDELIAGTLTDAGRTTPVLPDGDPGEYRLLGAVARVAAPTFAAPRVA